MAIHQDSDKCFHKFVPEEGPEDLKDCDTCSFKGKNVHTDCPKIGDSKVMQCTENRGNWRKIS